MHRETHTNPLKEYFIWTGSTYQRGNLWGTVEHGQTQIVGRMLFWKTDEVFLVYFFATASGSIMKTMKLVLVKSVPQKFWSSRFSPKHVEGCYNSFIYYHFHTRRSFPVSYSLSISLWPPPITVLIFSVEICSNIWLHLILRYFLIANEISGWDSKPDFMYWLCTSCPCCFYVICARYMQGTFIFRLPILVLIFST